MTPKRGIDLVPTFTKEALERTEPLYWEWNKGQAMRQGDWKIVREKNDKPWELYDLSADLVKRINLADNYPQLIASMDSSYQTWHSKYY